MYTLSCSIFNCAEDGKSLSTFVSLGCYDSFDSASEVLRELSLRYVVEHVSDVTSVNLGDALGIIDCGKNRVVFRF